MYKNEIIFLIRLINSENISSCEKLCILLDLIPEEDKKMILVHTLGMINMAKIKSEEN